MNTNLRFGSSFLSVLLRMRTVSTSLKENLNKHNIFFNRAFSDIVWKILHSRTGHSWQYGAGALLAK